MILASSDDEDDHFSDATEGQGGDNASSIPITRIEKVDNEPSFGEIPGTDAYNKRLQDAAPDEIAVSGGLKTESAGQLPGGAPIPITVVERVDPLGTDYGEVPGTEAWDKRRADAVPDKLVEVPDVKDPEIPGAEEEAAAQESGTF